LSDALLIVDVISTFDHADGDVLLAVFRERLDGFTTAIENARAEGLPILYVNDDLGRWDGDAPSAVREALAGKGADVVSRLAPQKGDRFLFKPRYSAFDHTPLLLVLQDLGVDRILLSGGATEGCVVQTGIDARELGLKATILANACATNDPELERVALAYAQQVGGIFVQRTAKPEVRDPESADAR
jgi:nicotinamidase-related amidase